MTRMTRELSLLVVGAGMLASGYFLWPEEDFEKRAEEQAQQRVGGGVRGTSGSHVVFISRAGGSVGRSPAMASVSRGGLGAIGGRIGGGG